MSYADSKTVGLSAESHPMNPILATVLKVDKRGNEFVVTVQLGNEDFSGPFGKLNFENKPDQGWYHYGWLDLIYHRDPDLRAGQVFPLWSASSNLMNRYQISLALARMGDSPTRFNDNRRIKRRTGRLA